MNIPSIDNNYLTDLNFDSQGLIPAVCQDAESLLVLMVAWMNPQAIQQTLKTGEVHFWSRSRGELWHKGTTSGNFLQVKSIRVDCDSDTLLLLVKPFGPACHTGTDSCFVRSLPLST